MRTLIPAAQTTTTLHHTRNLQHHSSPFRFRVCFCFLFAKSVASFLLSLGLHRASPSGFRTVPSRSSSCSSPQAAMGLVLSGRAWTGRCSQPRRPVRRDEQMMSRRASDSTPTVRGSVPCRITITLVLSSGTAAIRCTPDSGNPCCQSRVQYTINTHTEP